MKKAIYKRMKSLAMSRSRHSRNPESKKDSGQAGMTGFRPNAVLLMILVSLLLLLFISHAAQAKTQNTSPVPNKIETEAKKGGYQLITPEELKKEYLKDPTSFLLVDTRQEWSYQMQHIKGALHIDFAPTWWNQYSPMMRSEMKSLLGPDKNEKIVFY